MSLHSKNGEALERLAAVLKELREKCPWDKAQTFDSLRRFTIEELYELIEAIDEKNMDNVKEELGDMLTHIIFYANLAEEEKHFTLADLIESNTEKLIRRHPHIYKEGSLRLKDSKEVERNWEALKGKEKISMFSGLPAGLPSMIKAQKLQDKAERSGFPQKSIGGALGDMASEIEECKRIAENEDVADKEEKIGNLFFSMVECARLLGVDADIAMEKSNRRFKSKVEWVEKRLAEKGKKIRDVSSDELKKLWEEERRNT